MQPGRTSRLSVVTSSTCTSSRMTSAGKAILCPDSYHAMMVMGANYRSQYHPKMVGRCV